MKPLFEAKGIRLIVVSEPDRGIYDAMNKGLSYSKGDWINFMNAGDRFANSRVLEELFKTDIRSSEQVIYGDTILHLQFGDVTMFPKPIDYMRKKMAFCHQSTLVAGDLMRREKFDLHYRLAADYAFFIVIINRADISDTYTVRLPGMNRKKEPLLKTGCR